MNPKSKNIQSQDLKIILAEDHAVVRTGIKKLIIEQEGLEVVGEASNGQEVLDLLAKGIEVDILLSDINMPGMDGISLFRHLQSAFPTLKTVALSMPGAEESIRKCFEAGCRGYMMKTAAPEELIYALRMVGSGKKYLCADAVDLITSSPAPDPIKNRQYHQLPKFSEREIQILKLIAKGKTTKEIADQIFLSKRTVEGYRLSLLEKSGAKNTAALVYFAVCNGFIK